MDFLQQQGIEVQVIPGTSTTVVAVLMNQHWCNWSFIFVTTRKSCHFSILIEVNFWQA